MVALSVPATENGQINTEHRQRVRRALLWGAVLAVVVAGVVFLVWLFESGPPGDLYAFDSKTGAQLWHRRFSGVAPRISIRGGVLTVESTIYSGCGESQHSHEVVARFDGRSGDPVHEGAALPDLPKGRPLGIWVYNDVVHLRARPQWRARIIHRRPAAPDYVDQGFGDTASRAGFVYVAVTGAADCND